MTRPSLSTVAYEALVRARRKFSNREEHCIGAPGGSTFMQIGREDSK